MDYPSILLHMVVWERDCYGAEREESRYWREEGVIRKGRLVYMNSGWNKGIYAVVIKFESIGRCNKNPSIKSFTMNHRFPKL